MVLIDRTRDEMLNAIEFERVSHSNILVPINNKAFFSLRNLCDGSKGTVPIRGYLQSLADLLQLDVCVLEESFLNSYERGNNNDWSLPINVTIYEGLEGSMLRIEYSGDGFDYKKMVKRKKEQKPYYIRGGGGLFILNQPGFYASFEGKGNILNIQSPVSEDETIQ